MSAIFNHLGQHRRLDIGQWNFDHVLLVSFIIIVLIFFPEGGDYEIGQSCDFDGYFEGVSFFAYLYCMLCCVV